jgi:NAD(P)-dependent dehydrogenase (short-subunit alcohol dehydrogenase family)
MPTILVTGANRGIGLEFARQYADTGWKVFATCRTPDRATDLNAITGDISVLPLDVSDFTAIDALAKELAGQAIDVMVLNAGINPQPEAPPADLTDFDAWPEAFRVNTMAPLRMCVAFNDHIVASDQKAICMITSGNASIERNPGHNYVYRSTKAALNLCMHGLSVEYEPKGIIVVSLSPGWVQTDMGGPKAALTPAESISAMRQRIEELTAKDSGRVIHYDGTDVPF